MRLQNTEMAVLIVEGKAYQLTPSNEEVSFFFYIFSLFVVIFIDSTSSLVNVAKESREICARNQSGHLQANL